MIAKALHLMGVLVLVYDLILMSVLVLVILLLCGVVAVPVVVVDDIHVYLQVMEVEIHLT